MSDYLLYWKFYWEDIAENPEALNELWHTAKEAFWNKIKPNDNLWVVITGGEKFENEWRLLQKIVAQEKFTNFSYGRPYGIVGNEAKGEHFEISTQPDLTPLLHKLEFVSGKKIRVTGRAIGNTLQSIRPLTETDKILLEEFTQTLTVIHTNTNETNERFNDSNEEAKLSGAGFGNSETNRKVEKAAVNFVTEWYESEGWVVKSVESEKCGYDLLCQNNSKENHVEVKGVQGSLISFIITEAEVKKSQTDNDFVLCVVTSALTDSPTLSVFDGKNFKSDFTLTPISYRATLKNEI